MHQQLWGYKVEWKSVSRGTGGKKLNTTELGYELDDRTSISGTVNEGIFLLATTSRPVLRPIQPLKQSVLGGSLPGGKATR
jgi:hypothetical protein